MSDVPHPVLLQVCANDHPPFVDICRYYAAAAESLSWTPLTVMLATRLPVTAAGFHYLPGDPGTSFPVRAAGARLAECVEPLLDGQRPIITLCHRYRAYRAFSVSGIATGPVVVVAHEFAMLARRRRRLQRHWDILTGRPRATFAGVSQPVCEELTRITGQAALLPNGIDLASADAARLDRTAARQALGLANQAVGLADEPFTIGVVGRLHPKKNPELALEGFRLAAARMPGARLVFIGDGELAGELQKRAGDLPVIFKGFVPNATTLMRAFDLLLLPSGDREAFGMVAVEAMAAGVPVLCGPASGPRFVIGAAGRRFAPATAAAVSEALAKAYAERREGLGLLAGRARARVERMFSVPAAALRLRALAMGVMAPAEDRGSAIREGES
jgi:glycosyltransferase involved in cell wall biosynthesis